jgi:hypothetical protein
MVYIWRNSLSQRISRFVIRVIAESGLLYTLTSIATFCMVFISPTIGSVITSAIVCHESSGGPYLTSCTQNFPVAGIAYNLILIRVAQNRAEPQGVPSVIGDSTIERHSDRTAPQLLGNRNL